MSINFFLADCQSTTNANLFGICDNQDGSPAFIDTVNQTNWVARVLNDLSINITLTAIDNCIIILRPDGTMDRRCDAILTYTNNIVFLELKNQMGNWISDAIDQIETTIINFMVNNDISLIKHKRAYAANKKHPHFNYGNPERSQKFFSQYKVRLNIEGIIKI